MLQNAQSNSQDLYRYVVEEFAEDYRHGEMPRREFLRRLGLLAGTMVAGNVLLTSLGLGTASAEEWKQAFAAIPQNEDVLLTQQVEPTDPDIETENLEFEALGFKQLAYLAKPKTGDAAPGILVIHENRGLQPHIEDVARRLAKAGYVAIAPDLMSKAGGTTKFTDTAQISSSLAQTPAAEHVANLKEALKVLKTQKAVLPERLGVVGFCFGGGLTWRMATESPELKAAVPFYGPAPDIAKVPDIRAAVLGIYGGNDARINGGIPALEEALKKAGTKYQVKIFEGANHAFHNDTGQNYNKDAAVAAWALTLAWFKENL